VKANAFLSQVLYVAGGTLAGQLVVIAATPFITRLYPPSVVGVWAVFNALALTLSVTANLRYELGVVLPADDNEGRTVLQLCFVTNLIVAAATAGAIWLLGDAGLARLGFGELHGYRWLLPAVLLLSGIVQAQTYWCIRQRRFRFVAFVTVMQSCTSVGLQLIYAKAFGPHQTGLILGTVFGFLVAAVLLVTAFRRTAPALGPFRERYRKLRLAAARYSNFPKYVAPYGLISQVTNRAPMFIAVAVVSSENLAYFALAYRLTYLPVSIIGSALRNVLYPKAAREIGGGEFNSLVHKVVALQIALGIPALACFEAYAPQIFRLVLGPRWEPAGDYARWLALPSAAVLLSCWLDRIYDVMGKQKLRFAFELSYDVVLLTLYSLAINSTRNLLVSVGVYAIVSAIYCLGWLIVTVKIMGANVLQLVASLVRGAFLFLGFFASLWLARMVMPDAAVLAGYAALCSVYYFVVLRNASEVGTRTAPVS
jgi:O-antigen/teichoic acid export membrane protein